ncbi:hypothetical protein [Lactobacillus acetotolerans]|jgi:hypothetical protein|uniref:hypothetical protein n=1 Tax=Lactobacillus acetotolerans TaxID=1600 RepID=UPI000E7DD671|nr:hypothetical protein [Lactobacillus acetotolerans]HBG91622.1 hypothetical protein [Lactobacillus acetotolerans]HCX39464.1 hypothetical protein [Lactobacillus acetotolerans]
MNYKKILLIFIIFLTFLGTGSMLSNVQSREADQLLEAHGLSNNTRDIRTDSKETVKNFLQYLNKNYPHKKIQLHLDNNYEKNQILVWANHNIIGLPTESGRYFSPDDFQGQVSFAVLGPNAEVGTAKMQNNQYVIWGNQYYSVIGTLKHYHQIEQNKYYLTTGINQPTAQSKLNNYRIVIDSSNKVIHRVAKHYRAKVRMPSFVKKHQIHRFSIIRELLVILLFWIIAAVCNALLALLNWRTVKQTHLHGHLLRNWLINRSARLGLVELLVGVAAYIFLRWRAFYSKADHLGWLLLFSWLIIIVVYGISILRLIRKDTHSA